MWASWILIWYIFGCCLCLLWDHPSSSLGLPSHLLSCLSVEKSKKWFKVVFHQSSKLSEPKFFTLSAFCKKYARESNPKINVALCRHNSSGKTRRIGRGCLERLRSTLNNFIPALSGDCSDCDLLRVFIKHKDKQLVLISVRYSNMQFEESVSQSVFPHVLLWKCHACWVNDDNKAWH